MAKINKLITIEEAISTLSSSTQVRFVDRQGGDSYLPMWYKSKNFVSVKWLKKNHDDKYQKDTFGYIWNKYKVTDVTTDEYGRVTLHLNCGLTKAQEVKEDKKYRKEHNGMSKTEVSHRKASRWLANLAALQLSLLGCCREDNPWFESDLSLNRKDRRK